MPDWTTWVLPTKMPHLIHQQQHHQPSPSAMDDNSLDFDDASDDSVMDEVASRRRRRSSAHPGEKAEDIDANWEEVDSDFDTPSDDSYNPLKYRLPVSKLERASIIAADATANVTVAGLSLASAATSIMASAANTAVQTAIHAAATIAAPGETAYMGESRRRTFDELRMPGPGQRLALWETERPDQEWEETEGPEDAERLASGGTGTRELSMDLSEIVKPQKWMSESQETRRLRREKVDRRNGSRGAGPRLKSHREGDEGDGPGSGEDDVDDDDDDDNSVDSCREVLENRGEYEVEKAQRLFLQRQQKRNERKKRERRARRQKKEQLKEKSSPVQQRSPRGRQANISTKDEEGFQLQTPYRERSDSMPRFYCHHSRDTEIQPSRPRRPPSPGSSTIAMISHDVHQLPRSHRSNTFFEWD